MNKIKGTKKLVNYGLINLLGFSLFIGCSIPYYPVDEFGNYDTGDVYYNISFLK